VNVTTKKGTCPWSAVKFIYTTNAIAKLIVLNKLLNFGRQNHFLISWYII